MGSPHTQNAFERSALVSTLDPASQNAGAVNMPVVDAATLGARRFLYTVLVGSVGAAGTVDFKLQASATSGGSYTDLDTNCKLTQIAAANKQAELEITAEALAYYAPGKPFLRGVVTVGTNACVVSATCRAFDFRYQPTNDTQAAYLPASIVQQFLFK